jgi:hypothetical protein
LSLIMETNPSPLPSPDPVIEGSPRKVNWLLFFAAMFLPTLLTVGMILLGAKQGDTAPATAALGGGISGIVCGTMLGRRFGRTPRLKILLGIISALVMGVACVTMNCFGCIASGYKLHLN